MWPSCCCFISWITISVWSGHVRFIKSLLFQTFPVSATEETQLPAEFILEQQKALWGSIQTTHPWVRLYQISHLGEVKSVRVVCWRVRAFMCTCVYILDVTSWLPQHCLHGNPHNKQLYLAQAFRGERHTDRTWMGGDEKVEKGEPKKEREMWSDSECPHGFNGN